MFLIAAEEADCPVGFLCDVIYVCCFFQVLGPGWLNELGSCRARVAQWIR